MNFGFALVQHMTVFCQIVSMSRLFETLIGSMFCHRTALRLYGVIEIQPLRGCKNQSYIKLEPHNNEI